MANIHVRVLHQTAASAQQALEPDGEQWPSHGGGLMVQCHMSKALPAVLSFSSPSLQSRSHPSALEGLHHSIFLPRLLCTVLGQLPAHPGCTEPYTQPAWV